MKRRYEVFSGLAIKWVGESFVATNGKKIYDLPGLLSSGFNSGKPEEKESILTECKTMFNEFDKNIKHLYPELSEKSDDAYSPDKLYDAWKEAWYYQFECYKNCSSFDEYRKTSATGFNNFWTNKMKPYHEHHNIVLREQKRK